MAENANRALSDRCSPQSGRGTASPAFVAISRTSDLTREVGYRPHNRLLRLARDGVLPKDGYFIPDETIARAAGDSNPIEHPHWFLWGSLTIRYHLCESADSPHRISAAAKLDTRGISSPLCSAGFADIVAMGRQTPGQDIPTCSRQGDCQDSALLPHRCPHFRMEGGSGIHDMIFSFLTYSVDSTLIIRYFCELRDELGLPPDLYSPTNASK